VTTRQSPVRTLAVGRRRLLRAGEPRPELAGAAGPWLSHPGVVGERRIGRQKVIERSRWRNTPDSLGEIQLLHDDRIPGVGRCHGRSAVRARSSPPSRSSSGPPQKSPRSDDRMNGLGVTIYGVCAVSFMMVMYALERRGREFILLFAIGCLLSSAYGFLSGAWPFGFVEFIWSGIALRRWRSAPRVGH
jgi:hypothetical protein